MGLAGLILTIAERQKANEHRPIVESRVVEARALTPNDPIIVAAAASTNVGVVQFFSNGNSVGVDQQSPFGVGLGLLPVGSYSLGTRITDTRGYASGIIPGPTFYIESPSISEVTATKNLISFNVHGGSAGQHCVIYASTNMTNPSAWLALSTNLFPPTDCATCPFVTFTDSNVVANAQRFFKAQVVP